MGEAGDLVECSGMRLVMIDEVDAGNGSTISKSSSMVIDTLFLFDDDDDRLSVLPLRPESFKSLITTLFDVVLKEISGTKAQQVADIINKTVSVQCFILY